MSSNAGAPATLKGKVDRAFYFRGEVLKVGAVCELPRVFALEMQAANKFTISKDEAPVASEAKGAKKGEKDAGK